MQEERHAATPGLDCEAKARGLPRLLLFAILCLSLLSFSSVIPGESHASVAGDSATLVELAPRKPLRASIARGAVHSFRVELDSHQFLNASISQENVNLRVALYDPAGRQLTEFICLQGETNPLHFVAETSGAYRLDVNLLGEESEGGSYNINLKEVRASVERDGLRVAAARSQSDGARMLLEWSKESLHRALGKYEEALQLWKQAGERGGELYALRKVGEILRFLGDLERSLKFYEQALKLSRASGDRAMEAAVLNESGYVLLSLGRNEQSLKSFQQALKLSRLINDRKAEAGALNNIGEAFSAYGQLPRSLTYYRQAQAIYDEIADRRGQAQTLLYLGYAYSDLSETHLALEFYEQALPLWRKVGDRRSEALTLTALGHLHAKKGEKQKALNLYDEARKFLNSMGDKVSEGFILNGMGYVQFQLGQNQRSLEYYQQALQLFREAGYREGEANSLRSLGDVSYARVDLQAALAYYQQSLEAIRAMSDKRLEHYALKGIGAVYELLGEEAKARGFYERALLLQKQGGDKREAAYTLNSIALFDVKSGQWRIASSRFQEALHLNRSAADPFGESQTLYNLARLERGRGQLSDARARIEASLEIVESLRTKVVSRDLRASYLASIYQYYEFYIDVLMLMHKARPHEGFDALALEASERARARSLLETLAEVRVDIRQGVDPALLERERQLQQSLNDKAERQMLLQGQQNKEAAALANEIKEVSAEYDAVRAKIRVANPHYAALTQPRPLSLKAIQEQVLDDDTLLLEYSLGEEKSYLWAVSRNEVMSYQLPKRAEIEEAARNLYQLLIARQPVPGDTSEQRRVRVAAADEQYWKQAGTLADMLLGPVAGRLGDKRLMVIPDGALQYIPFEALPEPGAAVITAADHPRAAEVVSSPAPLIIKHEIVNQPSASALALLRSGNMRRRPEDPKTVAVLADPVFERDDTRVKFAGQAQPSSGDAQTEAHRALRDVGVLGDGSRMPRLLASREEAEAIIAAAAPDEGLKAVSFDASRARAMSPDLGHYRIVHIATHGLLNDEHPELSGIVFSLVDERGQPVDGFLRLHDIYNLDLPVELVVLSACSTGLGKDVRGEGIVGLTRGFMYAGASSVIASLWKVDDEATAELMSHFYQNLLRRDMTPAAALREAKLTMWKQQQWRPPYYWAAFVLQGEYREKLGTVNRPSNFISSSKLLSAGMLVFLSAGWFHVVRRRRRQLAKNL
ncbi:MAG TPA: CHAT domain-containing protein [Pyrinomonadaceae bacterium]